MPAPCGIIAADDQVGGAKQNLYDGTGKLIKENLEIDTIFHDPKGGVAIFSESKSRADAFDPSQLDTLLDHKKDVVRWVEEQKVKSPEYNGVNVDEKFRVRADLGGYDPQNPAKWEDDFNRAFDSKEDCLRLFDRGVEVYATYMDTTDTPRNVRMSSSVCR